MTKKTNNKGVRIVFILFLLFLIISCGLDVYYILEPATIIQTVTEDSDSLNNIYNFRTEDSTNSNSSIAMGTAVYYKIYNSSSTRISDRNSISAANKIYSETGFDKLESLGYQSLKSSQNDEPLIDISNTDQTVNIRLFTEGTSSSPYKPSIVINSNTLEGVIPLRYNGDTFDFGEGDLYGVISKTNYESPYPKDGDEDVKYTEGESESIWYVQAYAVSVGRDSNFTTKYSQLLYLGFITIDTTK